MKISIEKTETMIIRREPIHHKITIENTELNQVDHFKYLGSMFTPDGRITKDIETRIQKANNVSYELTAILRHQKTPLETKKQLINAVFTSTLCYQAQTWTLNNSHEQRITACEMSCLWKVVNKIRDRLSAEEIRNTINIKPVTYFIEKQKLKWFGHVMRMEHHEIPYRVYNQKHSGKKSKRRTKRKMDPRNKGDSRRECFSSLLGKNHASPGYAWWNIVRGQYIYLKDYYLLRMIRC